MDQEDKKGMPKDLPPIWKVKLTEELPMGGGTNVMYAVVFAKDEDQVREIVGVLLKPTVEIVSIVQTAEYPLTLVGGYCTFDMHELNSDFE